MGRILAFVLIAFMTVACENKECENLVFENGITYQDGELFSGKCNTYKNKALRSIQRYKEGRDHGEWIFYFSNGNIQTKGVFKEGVRVGVWKYFNEDGGIKQINEYKNKRIIRTIKYNEKGEILSAEIN